MRDKEEDVDTRDYQASSHQHGQRYGGVEGPGRAAQREAAGQWAAETQRGRERGAGLAGPRQGRRRPQVQQAAAAIEAHRALPWQWSACVAGKKARLRGQGRQPTAWG